MPSQASEEKLQRFVKDVVCQICCRPEGYDRVRQLAVDFNADCGEDPEAIAHSFGFDSFTDFLHSPVMRTEIEIRNDQGIYVYVARPNSLVSHIHAEQMRSRHAREKKQEKERYYEQSAGTIGRRVYGDDGFAYNPPSDGFSVGLRATSQSRQPDNQQQQDRYSRADAPSRQSQAGYPEPSFGRYENPSPRDSARQSGGSGRQPSNGFGDDRHYDNYDSERGGANYQESRRQPNDYHGDAQPQRSYDNPHYDDGNDGGISSRSGDRRGNPPPLGFDTGLQQPAGTAARSGPRDPPSTTTRPVERPAPQRQPQQRDTPPTPKAPEDPVSAKNVVPPRQPELQPPAPSSLERLRTSTKTPPIAEAAAAARGLVWEEEDDDDDDEHGQNPSSQANAGFFGAVSALTTTAATKRLETNRRTVSDSTSDDDDDAPPPRQTAGGQSEKKDAAPASKPVTKWTSRAKGGEFTDSDEDEDDDEEEVDKTTVKMSKGSLYQNVTTFAETKGTLKPRIASSVSSSSDTSTLHNQQSPIKTLSPLKKKDSSGPAANPSARPVSTATTTSVDVSSREPASHGEKWLFEMKRQEQQRSQRDSANATPVAPFAATKSASAESTTTTVANAFRPVSRNSTTAPVVEPPALQRPTVVKQDKAANKIADWVNDKSPPKSATTANVAGSGGAAVPLRRTGSMTSVFSTTTSRRWSRVLSDDDLKRMSLVVNSVVQYNFPRTVFLDDLVAVVEMVEPRFASLEQAIGGDFLYYLERFCQRVEVIGRAGHYHLLWRDDGEAAK